VKHYTHPEFWKCYERLRPELRAAADKSYEQLKSDPKHPSLHFKKIGRYWTVRVGISHRALAIEAEDGYVWFWIGGHNEYDRIVDAQRKK
jgi:hypothetical protein